MNKASRAMIRDASIMAIIWIALWASTGKAWISASAVLLSAWLMSARARVLLHQYIQNQDVSVLPLLNSPESDVAYIWQQQARLAQKRQEHLREQLEQINTALRSVDRGFILLGEQNQLRWFNNGAERYLGLRSTDLAKPLDHYLRDPAFGPMMGPITTNQLVVAPSPLDPERTFEYNAFPDGEDGKVIIIRDVTRLRQLEKTRSDFASNVSHELKTPLTVIKGYSESLGEMHESLPAVVSKAVKQIQNQANRMQDIVEDLLWLNRLESTQLVDPTDLNMEYLFEQVRSEALELGQTLERSPTIRIQAEERSLNGNHREILTAVRNLTFNALRYGPPDVEIDMVWRVKSDRAELMIKDNGAGIPRSQIRRVTERFYRVDQGRARNEGGTGLGLSIVKHVAERHNGKLRIRSLVGKGSEFICQFPLERLTPEPKTEQSDLDVSAD